MEKAYTRIFWKNESESQTTPLGATNLNTVDYAVDEIDNRVITLDTVKTNESEALTMISNVEYNSETGTFTFTRKNGTQVIADLNIEKIPVSFYMTDEGIIVMKTSDGSTYTADVKSLISEYQFLDSDTVSLSVEQEGMLLNVSAEIIDGSITQEKLNPDYLADINLSVAQAQEYASASETSAGFSAGSELSASASATEAKSWAIGGTDTRAGEDINNAKYWCEQAESKSGIGTGNLILIQNGETAGTFNANSKTDIEIELDGGSNDYSDLSNKPSINGVTLEGNKTTDDLGIDGGAKAYTTEEWEELDHDDIEDGTQIIITDDYSSTICSTISECEASENLDDVAGASALAEISSGISALTNSYIETESTEKTINNNTYDDFDELTFVKNGVYLICLCWGQSFQPSATGKLNGTGIRQGTTNLVNNYTYSAYAPFVTTFIYKASEDMTVTTYIRNLSGTNGSYWLITKCIRLA